MAKSVLFLFALASASIFDTSAQVGDDPRLQNNCSIGIDSIHVETSGFDVWLRNDNRLIGSEHEQKYSIRNPSWPNPLSSIAVWFAGEVGNEEKISGNNGFYTAFMPGMYPVPEEDYDCRSRNIFKVTRGDIESYRRTGIATGIIQHWPVHLGAPVIDGDGIPGNYSLEGGDLPALKGDELYWWTMSDWSGRHPMALDLEVAVSAFVFGGSGALSNTLFLSYEFSNAGSEAIENAYSAVYSTPEFPDEFAGVDTTRAVMYAYNANDSISRSTKSVTPAVGFVLLDSQLAHEQNNHPPRVRSFFAQLSPGGGPDNENEYLFTLNGFNARREYLRFGGLAGSGPSIPGCQSNEMRTFVTFPGDPVTRSYWSMEQPMQYGDGCKVFRNDGTRQSNVESMNISTAMADIEPGKTVSLTFAVVWAVGDDRLDSVRKLFSYADLLHGQREHLLSPSVKVTPVSSQTPDLSLTSISPNPVDTRATLEYTLPSPTHIRIRVFDVLGRIMEEPVNSIQQSGTHSVQMDVSAWSPGPYFVRYEIANRAFTRTMMVL